MIYAENKGHSITGIDTCRGLIKVCKDKGLNVQHGNAINQIYVDGIFDFCMSIAVFHHLATEESRNKAVMNMINVLKSGGKGLITVWAVEQNGSTNKKFKPGNNIVKWNKPYDIDNKRHYEQMEEVANCKRSRNTKRNKERKKQRHTHRQTHIRTHRQAHTRWRRVWYPNRATRVSRG